MAIGAILITTGCGTASGAVCGGITVAQRMIASLRKSGVTMIVVVAGPEDKKLEKQLSVQLGLNFLSDKCDDIF